MADRITVISGAHKHLIIKSAGKIVYDTDNLHNVTFVKKKYDTWGSGAFQKFGLDLGNFLAPIFKTGFDLGIWVLILNRGKFSKPNWALKI